VKEGLSIRISQLDELKTNLSPSNRRFSGAGSRVTREIQISERRWRAPGVCLRTQPDPTFQPSLTSR